MGLKKIQNKTTIMTPHSENSQIQAKGEMNATLSFRLEGEELSSLPGESISHQRICTSHLQVKLDGTPN